MATKTTVNGLAADSPLWFVLALEGAAAMHWPNGLPPAIAERLPAIREAAARFTDLASELSGVLLLSDVEGVHGATEDTGVDLGPDHAAGLEFESDSEDDNPEPWKS